MDCDIERSFAHPGPHPILMTSWSGEHLRRLPHYIALHRSTTTPHNNGLRFASLFMYIYVIKYACVLCSTIELVKMNGMPGCCNIAFFECHRKSQFSLFASLNNLLTNECMPSLGPHPNTHTHTHPYICTHQFLVW